MADQNKVTVGSENVHVSATVKPLAPKQSSAASSRSAALPSMQAPIRDQRAQRPAVPGAQRRQPAPAPRRKIRVPRARRMRLSITKIDPWSVAKVSFLLSIAWGIIQVVCMSALYAILAAAGVFTSVEKLVTSGSVTAGSLNVASFFDFGKIISIVVVFAILQVLLIVIMSTLAAFIYNVVAMLVGGVHVTLGDD